MSLVGGSTYASTPDPGARRTRPGARASPVARRRRTASRRRPRTRDRSRACGRRAGTAWTWRQSTCSAWSGPEIARALARAVSGPGGPNRQERLTLSRGEPSRDRAPDGEPRASLFPASPVLSVTPPTVRSDWGTGAQSAKMSRELRSPSFRMPLRSCTWPNDRHTFRRRRPGRRQRRLRHRAARRRARPRRRPRRGATSSAGPACTTAASPPRRCCTRPSSPTTPARARSSAS